MIYIKIIDVSKKCSLEVGHKKLNDFKYKYNLLFEIIYVRNNIVCMKFRNSNWYVINSIIIVESIFLIIEGNKFIKIMLLL